MIQFGRAIVILALTVGFLALFFVIEPFEHASAALDRAFGALPAWKQVEGVHRDPATQELSHGENPLESFQLLDKAWAAHPETPRIVLMGNSQTQMVSLSRNEPPPVGAEKTYTDQVADHYRETGSALFYRLSAGALSYEEMLWYVTYLTGKPALRPGVILVQLNYQNFINTGIRGGMLSLLADPEFRQKITAYTQSGRPESASLAEALRAYQKQREAAPAGNTPATNGSAGEHIETSVRTELARVPGFERRAALKQSFSLMMIRYRTYVFRIAASGRRSLRGARIDASRAALEDLAELCARSGIRLILFQAPTNPAVPLYKTTEDDRDYHDFCASLASRYGLTTLDFEHGIPAEDWGMTLNVPDPLHLSRQGHKILAGRMLEGLRQQGF